jgi:methyl-accepting chemotaxis protein
MGVVEIQKHTEFEVLFTDPATNQLHPGVRETMRNGNNLFVTYPGYPDYRHILVIGAGVTFSRPGSPDKWGMMCEGDLEEVYAFRGQTYENTVITTLCFLLSWAGLSALYFGEILSGAGLHLAIAIAGALSLMVCHVFHNRSTGRFNAISQQLFNIAEKGASLSTRVDGSSWPSDESAELARWINSFVDRTESAGKTLQAVASSVSEASGELTRVTQAVSVSSQSQFSASNMTSSEVGNMIDSIAQIAEQANATKSSSENASSLSEEGRQMIE